MSDEYRVGYKQPPKHTQFQPGQSGNPNGRRGKPPRALVPSQLRRDVLEVADEILEVKTAKGTRRLSKHRLIIQAISNGAAKGNPTCLKLWVALFQTALQERRDIYPSVRLAEHLMHVAEPDQLTSDTLDGLLRTTKGLL